MQQKIMDALGQLNDRLAALEIKTAALARVPKPLPRANADTGTTKPTASDDADYFAAAFAAGLSLSQQRGYKSWQTVVGALLPAATRSLDESAQGNASIITPALAPAAISGAAYFLGRYIGR
jgi:hypothetical protein